jgi:hypothetical protein
MYQHHQGLRFMGVAMKYQQNSTSGLLPKLRLLTVAVLNAVMCFALLVNTANAQGTAQISGIVTDSSGASIPGAQVQITNTDTNAVRTVRSSDDGSFNFPALAVGPYKLEVTKQGFRSFVQSGIVLQLNTNPSVNVTLQVGSVSQTVEVSANAAMVETQSTSVGQVIQPEQVVDLPLNNRQATQLIALAGASVNLNNPNSSGTGSLSYVTNVSYSVAGSQSNATNYLLDGTTNLDYQSNVGLPMPFPDALQEFKVESSAMPASSGRNPGGVVGAITKSGTNQFHGDLFEFLRNGIFDADAFNFPNTNGSLPTPTHDNLKRNQFGGTLGGPIKKDKVFFFYGFQETVERQQQLPTTRTVPTPAMLAGDFTAFLATPCQSSQQYLNEFIPSPTPGGPQQQLTTALQSNKLLPAWLTTPSAKAAARVAALFPAPNNACGSVTTSGYQHDNEYQHVARTDWQRTGNDTIFARYFIANYNLLSSLSTPGDILTSSGDGLADRLQNVTVGDTHIFTPQTISSSRLSYVRTAVVRTSNNGIPNLCSLGVMGTCPTAHIISALYLEPGNQGWDYENAYGASENVAWQIGSHQLQFGVTFEHIQMNGNATFQLNPLPAFTSGSSSYSNNNLADFVTGNVDSYGQGNGQLSRDGQNLPSFFAQDSWKTKRTFQVNYGLRLDPYFPQHNGYSMASDFSLAGYDNGVQSKVFTNAAPGLIFPGDAGFNGRSDTRNRPWDFSPRIGVVWDPRGRGLETIRAAYGLFYDTSNLWNDMHIVLNAPWGNTVSFTPAPVNVSSSDPTQGGGLANPWFGQPGGNIFPTPFKPPANYPFFANGAYVFQTQNVKAPNSQQWNLSVQKQMGANWLVSATYLGNKTTHILLGNNWDPDVVITAGMTAPGIVANNVAAGNPTSGSCTLYYGGTATANQYTFNPCNSTSTAKGATVNGINDESARKALNLANPNHGYKMNGGVIMGTSLGDSAYNGLLVSVQHRLSQGFSINGNYTWSHCLDDGEVGIDVTAAFENPANPKADWGNCGTDRRQIYNLSLVAQTPKFSSGWVEGIVGNWTASGIFTASTGSYANVLDGADISLIGLGGGTSNSGGGSGHDRPNKIGDPFAAGTIAANPSCTAPAQVKTIAHWFTPCAYQTQTATTFGNTARNSLLGPGHWNFDAAVWRTFPLTERFKVDFRFEGFNVFNDPQFGNPAATLSSTSTLGRITSTVNNQRILQAALKITF